MMLAREKPRILESKDMKIIVMPFSGRIVSLQYKGIEYFHVGINPILKKL